MTTEKHRGGKGSTEMERLMGGNRSRAINAIIEANATGHNPYGLIADDFRCGAEQVEIGRDGIVRKSSSNTKPFDS